MNQELKGEQLGGPLENLRETATVYLPRMANDYTGLTQALSGTAQADSNFDRSGELGPQSMRNSWSALRNLMWTSSDYTSDRLYSLADGLRGAFNAFVAQDHEAAEEVNVLRGDFERKNGDSGKEWNKKYGNDETAPPLADDRPGVGGQ